MQANILPFYKPTTSRWGQKVKTIYFLKEVMLHIKLKGEKCRTLCKFDLKHIPDLLGLVKRSDTETVPELILGWGIVIITLFWQYRPQFSSFLRGYFSKMPRSGAIPVILCVFSALLFAFWSLHSVPFV